MLALHFDGHPVLISIVLVFTNTPHIMIANISNPDCLYTCSWNENKDSPSSFILLLVPIIYMLCCGYFHYKTWNTLIDYEVHILRFKIAGWFTFCPQRCTALHLPDIPGAHLGVASTASCLVWGGGGGGGGNWWLFVGNTRGTQLTKIIVRHEQQHFDLLDQTPHYRTANVHKPA